MDVLNIAPVRLEGKKLLVLDQTQLPGREVYIEINNKEDLFDAIFHLKVRGAPAIGVAAAYGMWLAASQISAENGSEFLEEFLEVKEFIGSSRPTAVNLFWALDRMEGCLKNEIDNNHGEFSREKAVDRLLSEAERIRMEDEDACRTMGELGLTLLEPGIGILTHCNAGTIATAKYGTALAPIYLGQERGYGFRVFADETRPLLQGARLTAWELQKAGVDVTLICDNMASLVMKNGWVQAVVVGCDRMAANGDGANKIGTSGVAILAKEYGIPFYMFVPTSTIDLSTKTGEDIIIEERDGKEIGELWYEKPMAPAGVKTYNPAFDVTPAKYITAVITEKGIVRPPYSENLAALINGVKAGDSDDK